MIELRKKQILIDGKPQLIIGGEIHYYRTRRKDWQTRIDQLKSTGANMVASYIPWVVHEQVQGRFDFKGHSRPEYDVEAFIELCEENDMYFFARPGPFVMAEMKNEGIPFWVAREHPEIVPVGWDGKKVPGYALDYLAPAFLAEVRHWYSGIMPILAKHLYGRGGKIIGVQLDNEVGMLSWVTNFPELTDVTLADFAVWLKQRYPADALRRRYPFSFDDVAARASGVRSPKEDYAAELRMDLGHYLRYRSGKYFLALKGFAEEFGVRDTLFAVNIHGTGGGRATPYPIGISQLYESFPGWKNFFAGSDHYLDELHTGNVQDLYVLNMLTDCVNSDDQPMTSLEFPAGSVDYGGNYQKRVDPSSIDFHIRMSIAQNARLINYYLFAGGWNWHLDPMVADGNGRIGITGERHGTASPINPEGKPWIGFDRLIRATQAVMVFKDKLAVMEEEHDDVELGFIPDYFMTEFRYPTSEKMATMISNLEEYRGVNAWDIIVKAMMLSGLRFTARDVQKRPLDPKKALVIGSAAYMERGLQQKLIDYVRAGGRLVLYGEIPQFDMEMNPCTILADALGVKPRSVKKGWQPRYYLAVQPTGPLAAHHEHQPGFAQEFDLKSGTPLMKVVDGGRTCAAEIPLGKGKAVLFATNYRVNMEFWKELFARLELTPAITNDYWDYGIFASTSKMPGADERFLHLMNLDNVEKTFSMAEHGRKLFEGRPLQMRGKESLMIPLKVRVGRAEILWATCEVMEILPSALRFRLTQPEDVIVFSPGTSVALSPDYRVEKRADGSVKVTSNKHACVDDRLIVTFL